MAIKTNTTSQNTFRRTSATDPSNVAVFEFGDDPTRPGLTKITLPEGSSWTPSPHWHETHVEYFRVLKGRVRIILNGVEKIVTPDTGIVCVDRFVVHDFMRADCGKPDDQKEAGEVITEEWTDPADGIKQVFFRNVFSVLQDSESYWKSWTGIQLLLIASTYDEFPVLWPGRFSYATTHMIYAIGRPVAQALRLKPWQEEYTPQELRTVASGLKSHKPI